ncbi:hypothetical protein AO843_00885 [Lysinibacillus sp. ZYM-1]|nr:hypothetical protein AO843_00885 [Lysinibacillus sp. ZYM-1]
MINMTETDTMMTTNMIMTVMEDVVEDVLVINTHFTHSFHSFRSIHHTTANHTTANHITVHMATNINIIVNQGKNRSARFVQVKDSSSEVV